MLGSEIDTPPPQSLCTVQMSRQSKQVCAQFPTEPLYSSTHSSLVGIPGACTHSEMSLNTGGAVGFGKQVASVAHPATQPVGESIMNTTN